MKLTVNAEKLATELRLAKLVAPDKPTIPILSYVMLEARGSDGELHVFATNLDLAFRSMVPATVSEIGTTTVSAAKLLEAVEPFGDEALSLTLKQGWLHIACREFQTRLATLSPLMFPAIPAMPEEGGSILPTKVLQRLIRQTDATVPTGALAPQIVAGAQLAGRAGVLGMVSHAGSRLHVSTHPEMPFEGEVVLHASVLRALVKLPAGHGETTFSTTDQHLFFRREARILAARQLDARFPAYDRITAQTHTYALTVSVGDLTDALKRVKLALNTGTGDGVTFTFSIKGLRLSAQSMTATAEEPVPTTYLSEPPTFEETVKLNWKWVLDALNAAEGASVDIKFTNAVSPVSFTDGTTFMAIVMGMK